MLDCDSVHDVSPEPTTQLDFWVPIGISIGALAINHLELLVPSEAKPRCLEVGTQYGARSLVSVHPFSNIRVC